MNVKEWLKQVRKLDQLIEAKLAERDRLIAIATDVSSKPIDGMPYDNTGGVPQKMQNAVLNLIELAGEIDKLIDKYVDCKNNVVKALEGLPEKEYSVLHRHYIRYMTWEDVARSMGYDVRHVYRVRDNGYKILKDVIECQV